MNGSLNIYPYLCIEGNIGSGKTTLANLLAMDLDATLLLEQFSDNPFLPEFYKDKTRYAFPVEVFFLAERHKQMESSLMLPDLFKPQIVSDYCFYKTALFASQNLNEKEFGLFHRLYSQLEKSILEPGMIVYLDRPVESLLQNIQKRNRDFEAMISAEYLITIQHAYRLYLESIQHLPVLILRLGSLNFSTDSNVYNVICENIDRYKSAPGTHHVNLVS